MIHDGIVLLCLAAWLQVVDKDSDAVLDEIEAAIYQVASSILAGAWWAQGEQ